MIGWKTIFEQAHEYAPFLDRHATTDQKRQWDATLEGVEPSDDERRILAGFMRTINVLCLAGAWCPDCVAQCPILQRLAAGNTRIDFRFLDRDSHPSVAEELRICGGDRVPVVVFLSEDFAECGRYGDRTLSAYRRMASEQLGFPTTTPAVSGESTDNPSLGDWLREFERVQLMLRLSPRLRRLHGD